MVDRPTEYPRWASTDVVDPVTLSPNVIEPPEEKKDIGWSRLEPPPRQWQNWLSRVIYDWIAYFDQQLNGGSDTPLNSFTPSISGLGGGGFNYPVRQGYYTRVGNRVLFSIQINWASNSTAANVVVTGLPFLSKNTANFFQVVEVCRGAASTLTGKGLLKGLIAPNATSISIVNDSSTAGTSTVVNDAGASGALTITGSYLIEA